MEGATAPQSLLLDLRKLEGDYNHFIIGLKYLKTFEAICRFQRGEVDGGEIAGFGWRKSWPSTRAREVVLGLRAVGVGD